MPKQVNKSPLLLSVCLGFVILIPLIVLELVNRWRFNEQFPMSVFIFTWVLQIIFIYLLMPLIYQFQSGKSVLARPLALVLRVAALVLITYIWTAWIVDQWPCFMGVPNCD